MYVSLLCFYICIYMHIHIYIKKKREGGLDSFCTAEVLDVLSHGVNLAHERLQKVVVRTTFKST